MKILIIAPSNEGTIAMCTNNLYKALDTNPDLQVTCVMMYKYSNGVSGLENCKFLIDRTKNVNADCSYWDKLHYVRQIKKQINPDVSISTLIAVNTFNVLAKQNDKIIGIFHAPFKQAFGLGMKNAFMQLLSYCVIFPFFDKCFCVSTEVAHSLLHFPFLRKSNVKVVYNVHNQKQILNKAQEGLSEDEERFFSNRAVMVYVGRIDENKAPNRAIKAFAKSEFSKHGYLAIIGPGTVGQIAKLNELIDEMCLKDKVRYFGAQSNPYKFMWRSHMLISSSYSEGLPGVMIESLCLHKPIVTTNSSEGIWEIMGVHEEYKKKMSNIYVTKCGVISANSGKNSDIERLAVAIDKTSQIKIVEEPQFLSYIKADFISKQILKYIQIKS